MQTKATLKLAVILLAATVLSGYAFQADDLMPGLNQGKQAALVKAQKNQAPTAQQLAAAQSLPDVEVKWDAKTGAPLSIRGQAIASKNLGGKGLTISGKGDYAQNAIAVLDSLTSVYRLQDASREFQVKQVESDNLGFHHVRVAQVYQGLRVIGGELIVHFNRADQAYQVNGNYVPDLAVKIESELDKAAAVNAAQLDLAAMDKPEGKLKKEPELVIYARNALPVLAYELVLTYSSASAGTGNWCYWIDANNGTVVNRYNDIRKVTIQGNILTGEGGQNVTVEGTYQAPYYFLYNSYSAIRNADNTGAYPDSSGGNYPAYRTSTDWGASDRTEMSAAYNFYLIQYFYYYFYSRSSYDNAGTLANVYVHFPGGTDNAYWSPDYQAFFFYPGSSLAELTVLDITGHEFTHAVTEKTANLVYQYESGALNESFSDIFGALIEFAYQPDGRSLYPNKQAGYADWLLAEDCSISTICMRDMRNPSSPYTSMYAQGYPQPSKYQGSYWYSGDQDNGGVHINSGVQNFFFYLLCEGGSGNNDGRSYSVNGIGIANARQVAYRALTVYCSQNTDHQAARTAWISAAQDLNSGWVDAVKAAWDAVGITEGGGGGSDYYYEYYQYYYALCLEYYSLYEATGSYYYLAYTYYYYAYTVYCYYMYYGDSASANAYYNYYMYYAQYYYDLYQNQGYYQYYLTYYEYSSIYYSYYLQTGDYYYLAYAYYYYAYAAYCYYMYYGDSASANAYYNYYMYWAQYYYELSQYYIADEEKPAA